MILHTKFKKIYIFKVCLLVSLTVFSINSKALIESPRTDSLFYYRIGGGRHVTIPPSLAITTINLSATATISDLTCGSFDPVASIESSLEDLKNGVDDAINALEAAAGAAIANLPGYILQKANPGLYDLFQNALLRAQESFSIATKSCERIQHEISQNINPYAEWVTLSRGDSWKRSIGVGETNIHTAEETAETGHNQGLTWIGGIDRGGENQRPIRVLSEVASAGLNILSDRKPELTSNLPNSAPLKQHFAGPNAVSKWITDVLGDLQIGVCDTCNKGAQPGKGLIPFIENKAESIASDLVDLVKEVKKPNRTNLEKVSAPGIVITLQVIKAIQNQSPEERGIVISKLSQEIAEARIMEEATIIRRLLLTGSREVNVTSAKMALKEVHKALEELDDEIENVIFEKEIRNEFVTNTVIEVLLKDNAMRQSSVNTPANIAVDDKPLRQGVVKP